MVELPRKDMPYGPTYLPVSLVRLLISRTIIVRLGKSGLKVSRIILGCMSYGSPEQQTWVLNEEEGLKHIKAA